jgi:UDP-N-acetylmuramoylalanine--D-glutamate ligase
MIPVAGFRNDSVAVMGLARSGLAAAQALARGGARVMAWDDAAERRSEAERAGIPLVDLATADLAGVKALVLSPGIPHSFPKPHRVAARAREAGIEIVSDIELLAQTCRAARYVGITGTNGKSTTTALIAHLLAAAGRKVAAGGNIGVPALGLEALGSDGIYVLEMSSYQLELTHSLAFDVAVLLNITPDHLDRHGGMAGYIAAKERVFRHQGARHCAVIGTDDAICREIIERLAARHVQKVVPVSAELPAPGGVSAPEGWLIDEMGETPERVLDLRTLERLPGRHNWQNAVAAYAAVRCLGLDKAEAVAGLKSFAGLAHRQELIAVIDGVRYVNDSKATNADAAEKALACNDNIYWIAGGVPKEGGIASLARYFPRIRHAYLIGEAAKAFAATLGDRAPSSLVGTLEAAIDAAHRQAPAGATVLLSPACASFDQFQDYEQRGERFRALVEALPGARR